MAGKGKANCTTSPIAAALTLDDMGEALSGRDEWAEEALATVEDNANLDPAGYAREVLGEVIANPQQSQASFREILGCGKELSEEEALCYLMAIRMRGDTEYRWTKDQLHSYLNSLSLHLGGKPVSKYMLDKWVAMHFDPAWEPRTEGQRPGQLIGNPLAAEQHLLRNAGRLREEHEITDALLDESREVSRRMHKERERNPDAQGLAEMVARDAESSGVDSELVNQEYRAYVRAVQQIIERTGRVRPHSLPEGDIPESTKVLFSLIGQKFNETLLKEGAFLYAQGKTVSGKEAEDWWRETMMKSMGIFREGLKMRGASGATYKVVSESSSRDVFDLVVTIEAPGKPPFHLTLQFKSYQDRKTDPSSSFHMFSMGGVRNKDGTRRRRTNREMAQEIEDRLLSTGAFASISIDPSREGKICDLRQADKVVHRAECLHPEIQKALSADRLTKAFRNRGDGARVANLPVTIDGQEIKVTVKVNQQGKVDISGLDNRCWIPINTSTLLTETGARADHKLLNRLVEQERQNLADDLSGAELIDQAIRQGQ